MVGSSILCAAIIGLAASKALAQADYSELLCQYTDWDCAKAYRVMLCESTGNPTAVSGSQVGLFQVAMQFHSRRLFPGESLFDPEVNTRVAHDIWLESSWAPWPICGTR